MPEPTSNSPIQRLINAIRRRAGAGNLEEAAGAGKDAAQSAADMLPEGIIPHKGLEAAKKRQAMLDAIGRD
jgi:hypothetical protein